MRATVLAGRGPAEVPAAPFGEEARFRPLSDLPRGRHAGEHARDLEPPLPAPERARASA